MSTSTLIPVLDLAHGKAVHAVGGRREQYRPVESVLVPDSPGDALALARAYRTRLRVEECYVADLDAIEGGPLQLDLLRGLADSRVGFGTGLLVDAGAVGIAAAIEILDLGARRVIAALESLQSWAEVERMVQQAGSENSMFSLDLWNGRPRLNKDASADLSNASAETLVDRAIATGVGRLLVIELTSVGRSDGPSTLPLLRRLAAKQRVPIYAGGGVRGKADVDALIEAGAGAVLVGTAIHAGAIAD